MDERKAFIEILDSPPAMKPSKLSLNDLLNGNRKLKQLVGEVQSGESQKTSNSDSHCIEEDSIFDHELINHFCSENMISDENTSFSENEVLSVHSSPIKNGKLSLNDVLDGNKIPKKISKGLHSDLEQPQEKIDPHNVKLPIPIKFAMSLTQRFFLDNESLPRNVQVITDDKLSDTIANKKDKVRTPISSILTGNALPKKSKIDPRQAKINVPPELQQKIFSSFDSDANKSRSHSLLSEKNSSESGIIEIPECISTTKKRLSWKEIFRPKISNRTVDPLRIKLRVPKSFLRKLDDEESNIDPIFFAQTQILEESDSPTSSITPGSATVNNKKKQGSFKNKFFQEVYDRGKLAEKNSRLNTERQEILKEERLKNKNLLIMRALTREEFHVTENSDTVFSNHNLQKISFTGNYINLRADDYLYCIDLKDLRKLTALLNSRAHNVSNVLTDKPVNDSIIITDLNNYEAHEAKQIGNKLQMHLLWIDSFLPKDPYELLIGDEKVSKIIGWLTDSFNLLEKNYQLKKRLAYIKNNLINNNSKKKQGNCLDSFIDDSEYFDFDEESYDEEYNEDTREEQRRKNLKNVGLLSKFDNELIPYIPFLILYGDTGAGKTASVYCICKFLNAHVHEINSSQPHTRKALQRTLEELSTSKIVQNDRDVILFDDVDILFKDYDRAFWDLFYSVLSTSRKPIILTCTDITMLPDKLIELAKQHNSMIKLNNGSIAQISKYLKQKCMEFEVFDIFDNHAIEQIVKYNKCNLKKCIMELQLLSSVYKDNRNPLIKMEDRNNKDNLVFEYCIDGSDTLEKISQKLDMLSVADILEEQTVSMFDQKNDFLKNRLIISDEDKQQDISYNLKLDEDYYLDSEFINLNNESIKFVKELQNNSRPVKTLAFELNIGNYIFKKVIS